MKVNINDIKIFKAELEDFDIGDEKEFYRLFIKGMNLLYIPYTTISERISVAIPTIKRWCERKNAPHIFMRENVLQIFKDELVMWLNFSHNIVQSPGFYLFRNNNGEESTLWFDFAIGDKLTTRHYYKKPIIVMQKFFDFVSVEDFENLYNGKVIKKVS